MHVTNPLVRIRKKHIHYNCSDYQVWFWCTSLVIHNSIEIRYLNDNWIKIFSNYIKFITINLNYNLKSYYSFKNKVFKGSQLFFTVILRSYITSWLSSHKLFNLKWLQWSYTLTDSLPTPLLATKNEMHHCQKACFYHPISPLSLLFQYASLFKNPSKIFLSVIIYNLIARINRVRC